MNFHHISIKFCIQKYFFPFSRLLVILFTIFIFLISYTRPIECNKLNEHFTKNPKYIDWSIYIYIYLLMLSNTVSIHIVHMIAFTITCMTFEGLLYVYIGTYFEGWTTRHRPLYSVTWCLSMRNSIRCCIQCRCSPVQKPPAVRTTRLSEIKRTLYR